MMPSMAARLVSFADVQYRQDELAREFAESRVGRSRRATRRAARRATRNHRTATVTSTATARTSTTTAGSAPRVALPHQHRAHEAAGAHTGTVPGTTLPGVPTESTSVVVDDRLPVG
jgi:hypothetical protein